MTCTPDFTRSVHVLMCLGFPFRTMNDTIESVTYPLVGPLSQLADTSRAFTSFCMSGSREKLTTVAGRPDTTDVAWVPDGPYDCTTVTPCPALVALKAFTSTV